jgi:hypothetical protein
MTDVGILDEMMRNMELVKRRGSPVRTMWPIPCPSGSSAPEDHPIRRDQRMRARTAVKRMPTRKARTGSIAVPEPKR